MSLALYDTAAQAVSEFVPMVPGKVGIYVCGATVQSAPHVGHLRPAVAFDILRRWLTYLGYDVTLIRNVTDIDDKILAKAAEAGEQWWARANAVEREFTAAYDALNIIPPTYEPRATGHVPEMVELMQQLIDAGHAYATGPGNVWFDVLSWPKYGELTRQKLADLEPESDSAVPMVSTGSTAGDSASPQRSLRDPRSAQNDEGVGSADPELEKRSPYDFALWKAPREGEPATAAWDTPWGRGRPGWHLECSAMAGRYLGDEFDIHGGGLDLRFPHHENEQAQSRAAGRPFARRWMHSAWITAAGEKMSKSLGNGLLASELLAAADPAVVRYAIAQAHYRSMLEWSDTTLTETAAAWERITNFVTRAHEFLSHHQVKAPDGTTSKTSVVMMLDPVPPVDQSGSLPGEFEAAMNDDLNVPAALAVVHEHVRAGNSALAEATAGGSRVIDAAKYDAVATELAAVRGMLGVLGLDPRDSHWQPKSKTDTRTETDALDALVQAHLFNRAEARANKDWATADRIRDQLKAAGVTVEDSPTGPRWTLQ